MADPGQSPPREMLFIHVVSMFQIAAMQQLGKLLDPVSGETRRDLDQAKISIDILEVLKEKTQGNLTEEEESFLKKVLFELQMNYVEEKKTPGDEPAGEGEATAEDGDKEGSGD
jgi:hypothetical protein